MTFIQYKRVDIINFLLKSLHTITLSLPILFMCILLASCESDEGKEEACDLANTDVSSLLINTNWINPKVTNAVGFDIWVSTGCYSTRDFKCDGILSSRNICSTSEEATADWSWFVEDEIIFLEHEPKHANKAKFFKIKTLTSTILKTIEYFNEEDEFSKYLEFEYTAN